MLIILKHKKYLKKVYAPSFAASGKKRYAIP